MVIKMNINIPMESLIQNMKDAGCSSETIDVCISCISNDKKEELLRRLDSHRSNILDKIHKEERQINCLDYLVYQIVKG